MGTEMGNLFSINVRRTHGRFGHGFAKSSPDNPEIREFRVLFCNITRFFQFI